MAYAGANRLLLRNFVGLAVVILVALAAAWWAGDLLLLRRLRALVEATKRLGTGDLSARTGLPYGKGELDQLARAFDDMATSLQAQRAEAERAEARRRATEERFVGILDIAADAIIAVNADQRIILFNQGAERIFGYRSEEALGQPLDLLLPTRLVEVHKQHIRDFAAGPKATQRMGERSDVVGQRKDGTEFPAEASISRLSQNGEIILTVILRDVSERTRAEKELRRFDRALRVLSECNQTLVRATDESGLLQDICRIAVNLGGYRLAWIGFAEEDAEKTVRPVAQAGYEGGYLDTAHITWADTEKGRGPTGTAVRTGKPAVARDILTDPRFGPWRDEATKRGCTSSIALPLIAKGRILGALNVYAAEPDAFDVEEVKLLSELADDVAYGIVSLRTRVERERAEEEIRTFNAQLEQRVAERTAQLAERERELREAKEAADRANQAKSGFLSRMSHELRTPLNAIMGFAQLLEMDSLDAEQRESVNHILKGGRHLLELINEVLDIARIEAGRLSISPEPVSVKDAVQESLELIAPLAEEDDIRLESRLAGARDWHVLADRQRLKQILLNLLSNAVKYNRRGGAVAVSSGEVPEGRLRISVTDTGPGISPDRMERLFIPFDRLGVEQRGVEGTGLGLALSKYLAEAMGGRLGAESTAGLGSTFWVEFSLAEAPLDRLQRTDILRAPVELAASSRTRVVLYVEDNLSNLKLIQRLLAHRPEVRLLPAMQGRLGLDLAREHRPELILLDLHLPDVPGDEVLRQLRAAPETRHIPVVIISADATSAQIDRLLAAGARGYLTKPLDVRKLLALLDETLREREPDDAGKQA